MIGKRGVMKRRIIGKLSKAMIRWHRRRARLARLKKLRLAKLARQRAAAARRRYLARLRALRARRLAARRKYLRLRNLFRRYGGNWFVRRYKRWGFAWLRRHRMVRRRGNRWMFVWRGRWRTLSYGKR